MTKTTKGHSVGLSLLDLTGRHALVTGGGTGLGRQMSLGLAEAGARVSVVGRTQRTLDESVALITEAGGHAAAFACDVTDEQAVADLPHRTGPVDILVNNSGTIIFDQPWQDTPMERWREVLSLNLDAVFRMCQLYVPGMQQRAWGRVINIASIYASRTGRPENYPGIPWDGASYVTSKHGLIGFTRHLATQVGRTGVTVNALSPGMFPDTGINEGMLEADILERLSAGSAVGRIGGPEDLKAAVVFLASPGAAFVTGHDLVVDGGWLCW